MIKIKRPIFKKKFKSIKIKYEYCKGIVSVVLPVYNGEQYINEAIDSVLEQTYKKFELIIVNDGSVDRSGEIAEEYAKKDSRIKVIKTENEKLPNALNRGFSVAKGEFYTWISADNRMLPECLEIMVKELNFNKNADMVIGNMRLINENGERMVNHGWFEFPIGSGNVILPEVTPMLNIIPNNTIGAAFLYRGATNKVLGGYSPNQFMLEDYDYFMQMNSIFVVKHIKEKSPIYEYRMHPSSLTARDDELGITAKRPRLMEFDRVRRESYGKKLYGEIEELLKFCYKEMASEKMFKADGIGEKPCFYLRAYISNSRVYDEETPTYYIEGRDKCVYFHNYKCGVEEKVFFDCLEDMVKFLRIKILCDNLYIMEKEKFQV